MVLPPAAGNKSRATTSAAADCHPPPPGLTASPDASRSPACSNGPRVDGRSRYPTTHPVHHSVPPPPPGAPTDLRRDAPGRLFLRAIQSIQSIQSIHPSISSSATGQENSFSATRICQRGGRRGPTCPESLCKAESRRFGRRILGAARPGGITASEARRLFWPPTSSWSPHQPWSWR